jgi:hypothetical protein
VARDEGIPVRKRRQDRRIQAERLGGSWRRLGPEQRVAAVGAFLLAFSTLGPFSFVEAAQLLVCFALLALLKARADGRRFHLPFGDGTIVMVAGLWSAGLILVRLFDRPLGQGLLALVCAGIVAAAGLRERSKRPMDDVSAAAPTPGVATRRLPDEPERRPPEAPTERLRDEPTERLPDAGDEPTERLKGSGDELTERLPDPGDEPTRRLP